MPSREALETRLAQVEETLSSLESELAIARRLAVKVRRDLERLDRAQGGPDGPGEQAATSVKDPTAPTRRIRPPSAEEIATRQRTRGSQ